MIMMLKDKVFVSCRGQWAVPRRRPGGGLGAVQQIDYAADYATVTPVQEVSSEAGEYRVDGEVVPGTFITYGFSIQYPGEGPVVDSLPLDVTAPRGQEFVRSELTQTRIERRGRVASYDNVAPGVLGFVFNNYRRVFNEARSITTGRSLFLSWIANSFFIAVAKVLSTLLFASMAGYALARLEFPGKNLIFVLILFAQMIPAQVIFISNYLVLRDGIFGLSQAWVEVLVSLALLGLAFLFYIPLRRWAERHKERLYTVLLYLSAVLVFGAVAYSVWQFVRFIVSPIGSSLDVGALNWLYLISLNVVTLIAFILPTSLQPTSTALTVASFLIFIGLFVGMVMLLIYGFRRLRSRSGANATLTALGVIYTVGVTILSFHLGFYLVGLLDFEYFGTPTLLNSLWGVILSGLVGAGAVFIMKQFFESIPREIEEAAMIDGTNQWQRYWRVVLPMARPALGALTILTFQGAWNEFFWPFIVLTTPEDVKTLPIGLLTFRNIYGNAGDWGLILAGAVMSALPIIILFVVFQRYFLEGVSYGGSKE